MPAIARLRRLALIEGWSFLVLLGVAMPLKYLADQPLAVKVVGWLHGVLFIAVLVALAIAWRAAGWPLARVALVTLSALVPLGPFLLDRRMRAWEAEAAARR